MDNNFLWWRDGIIYQIYPRSFADSNNDGIGDLQGIISKLDYLQSLGIDALWLSPIFPSPDVDFGYDVSDYTGIDPKFGTMTDFETLVTQAKQRNIHILLDLVLNHTSDQHPWFIESTRSKDNPYHDWYIWHDPKPNGEAPNNWLSHFGGPGWKYDPDMGQYYYHMFYEEQPDVNWRHPDVRAAMLDVFRFWLNKGVDGFRLDVFNVYFKDSEFRDNPSKLGLRPFDRQEHQYDCSQPEMYPLLGEIRQILDAHGETYAVGETFLADPQQTASYCGEEKLHAAFNFDFADNTWNPKGFLDSAVRWYRSLADDAWPNNFLSNHDKIRAASRYCLGEDDRRAKVALAMLLTLRGTPFIYYGEEIGLRDIPVRRKQDIKDRVGLIYWPIYKGRDGCRAPMQWDNSENAGFSHAEPWLPVHTNYVHRNVAEQEIDPDSLLNFFRKIVSIRKSHPALRLGDFTPIDSGSRYILSFTRTWEDQTVLMLLNFSGRKLNLDLKEGTWQSLINPKTKVEKFMQLSPYQVEILEEM
jgi:alpha-glucosidase